MNGNGKPKLELALNQPIKIKLLNDEPITGQSSYGDWTMYNVTSGNEEMAFFAPDAVVDFIKQNSLKRGSELQITKSIIKDGKKNVPEFKIELISKPAEQKTESINNGNGKFGDIKKIMSESYKVASDLQTEFPGLDLNRVALSIFISQTKNGNGYQF